MLTICRLCLAKEPNFVIFNKQVSVRIITCTGLEVEPNDELPQLICDACRLRLEEFYYFRKRCHAADRRLRAAKRVENNPDCQTICLLEGDVEDANHLQDVSQCTPTACSEANAHWRQEAAKMIRTEIDTYKKELLELCKQQVREEIEQQVRSEVEEVILKQATKECHLKLLDGLFYEIESFFVRKRNAVVCERAFGSDGFISDSEAAELDSVSSMVVQSVDKCGASDAMLTTDYANLVVNDADIVELPDDEPAQQIPETAATVTQEPLAPPTPTPAPTPLPMVEINMQYLQPSFLREDVNCTAFLPKSLVTTPSKLPNEKLQPKLSVSSASKPKNILSRKQSLCRKHSLRNKERDSYNYKEDANCYRCRLKGLHSLNKTVS